MTDALSVKLGSSLFRIVGILLLGQSIAGWLLVSRGIREDQGLQQLDQLSQEQGRLEKLWGEHLGRIDQALSDWMREDRKSLGFENRGIAVDSDSGGGNTSARGSGMISEIVRVQRQTLIALTKIESIRAFRLERADTKVLIERRDFEASELTARLNRTALAENDPRWPEALRQELAQELSELVSAKGSAESLKPESSTRHFASLVIPSQSPSSSVSTDETLTQLQEWARTAHSEAPQVRVWSWRSLRGADPSVLVFQTTFEVDASSSAGSWIASALTSTRNGPTGSGHGPGGARQSTADAQRARSRITLKLERKSGTREIFPRLLYQGPRHSEDARRFSQGGTERIFWGWFFVSFGFLALAGAITVAIGRSASAPLRRLIHEIEGMEASDPSSLLRLTGGARADVGTESGGRFARSGDLLELLISRLRILFDDLLAERERWVEQNSERFSAIEAENLALKREREDLQAAHEQALQLVSELMAKQKTAGESAETADSKKTAA